MAMDDKKRERLSPAPQTLDKSEPGGVSTEEKELAEVCARFADLCQYFSQQNMDLPPQIVDDVRLASKLAVKERIAKMRRCPTCPPPSEYARHPPDFQCGASANYRISRFRPEPYGQLRFRRRSVHPGG